MEPTKSLLVRNLYVGLTEASPTCFNAFTTDSIHTRLTTVGKILPHANAKVVDDHGYITPVGQRGELCISGYQVFQGYWNNPEKTAEVLATDQYGVTWLKTGDEAFFDAQERCIITGRLKDIIIRGMVRFHPFLLFSGPFLSEPYISSHMYSRPNIATAADSGRIGGENIYPLEIEERLVAHPAITAASVIGVPDGHYGEVVGAFVQLARRDIRPTDHEMRAWVREKLGRHKEPLYVFVLGENGLSNLFPTTGSGKIIKPQLREIAVESLKERRYNE